MITDVNPSPSPHSGPSWPRVGVAPGTALHRLLELAARRAAEGLVKQTAATGLGATGERERGRPSHVGRPPSDTD